MRPISRAATLTIVIVVAANTVNGHQQPPAPPPVADAAAQPPQQDPNTTQTPPAAAKSPAAPAPTPGTTGSDQPLAARVIDVQGHVESAPAGVSALAKDGWTPVKLADVIEPGRTIRTGLRSYVNLQFGETTTVSIRSATHLSIDQCYRSATAEVVRMGLGYGTVRGGSTEGEIRADVIVDAPVATMAKRGTEGWQMSVEPGTGRFKISLAQYGLVEAIQKLRGNQTVSREVRPGQYATDANIANLWIRQDIFDRNVKFFSTEGMSEAEVDYSTTNTRGYSVMAPGAGGAELASYSGRVSDQFVSEQLDRRNPRANNPPTLILGPIRRPEGNFGTPDTFRSRGRRP